MRKCGSQLLWDLWVWLWMEILSPKTLSPSSESGIMTQMGRIQNGGLCDLSRQSRAGSVGQTLGSKEGAPLAGGLLVSQRLAWTAIPLDLVPFPLLLLPLPVSPGDCCSPPRTHPRVARPRGREVGEDWTLL